MESNLKQKLVEARDRLRSIKMSRTGKQIEIGKKPVRFYELKDFLPHVNEINYDLGIFAQFTYDSDGPYVVASLAIVDVENAKEYIEFSIKTDDPAYKRLDALTTLRRLVYYQAYEIPNQDSFVESMSEDFHFAKASKEQLDEIRETLTALNDTQTEARMCEAFGVKSIEEFSPSVANYVIKTLTMRTQKQTQEH